jgi:hypothetical protein
MNMLRRRYDLCSRPSLRFGQQFPRPTYDCRPGCCGESHIRPGHLDVKNAFFLPHSRRATVEPRTQMGMVCLDNIQALLMGGTFLPSRMCRYRFRMGGSTNNERSYA